MKQILTKCGYRCDLCPAYDRNITSMEEKKKISEGWFKYFGFKIPPEEIGCVGCLNDGKRADSNCPVRPCVMEKNLENCAGCTDYICDKLKSRMEFVDDIEQKFPALSDEDRKLFIRPYMSRDRLEKIRR